MIRFALGMVAPLVVLCGIAAEASCGEPAAAELELLRLVPADAAVTVAIIDLRGHLATMLDSKLGRSLADLPTVKDWLASNHGRMFRRSTSQIEQVLRAKLASIRDDLFGDAVVLTLHLAPGGAMDSARGLLLTRVRNRELMLRLINLANASDASIVDVVETGEGDRRYMARRFKVAGKESEFYRLFDDGTFAWSNSEPLIRGVIDRKAGRGGGLADDPMFQRVRRGLPGRALAVVHLAPRFVAQVLASAPRDKSDPREGRAADLVASMARSIRGVGLALEWRDGLVLHAYEIFDPKSINAHVAQIMKARRGPDSLARRIPATAIASASTPIDLAAVFDLFAASFPTADRPWLDSFQTAVRGVLLGRDLRGEILPRLGPGMVAYLEPPPPGSARFPIVGVVELRDDGGDRGVAAAIDNAFRTILCLYALDSKHQAIRLGVESRQVGVLRVTSIAAPGAPFSYAIGPDCFVLGTSTDAVERFGQGAANPRIEAFKRDYFPDARAYAFADLSHLTKAWRTNHDPIARHIAQARGMTPESARDLDQGVALLDLFEAAFLSVSFDADLTSVHTSIGLIAKK